MESKASRNQLVKPSEITIKYLNNYGLNAIFGVVGRPIVKAGSKPSKEAEQIKEDVHNKVSSSYNITL